MTLFLEGFFLQASLILALGAQNLFVLESGLRRRRHLFVAAVCSVCDFSLVLAGVLGAGTLFVSVPWLKIIFGLLGLGFLLFYGILKLKEAFWPGPTPLLESSKPLPTREILLTTLAFSLLNPHCYLDTIVLVGGYSSKFIHLRDRFIFGLGAGTTSVIWFFGLATLASKFSPILFNEKAMRIINFISGIILISLCVKLGYELLGWISG